MKQPNLGSEDSSMKDDESDNPLNKDELLCVGELINEHISKVRRL